MSDQESGRFSIIPARALEDRRLSSATLRVFSCLGCFSNRDGWCWPAVKTLAERLGISRQAVQKHSKRLVELGYLEVHPQTKAHGGNTANKYRLLFDRALFQVQNGQGGGQAQVAGGATPEVAGGATPEVATILKNVPIERPNKNTDSEVAQVASFQRFWAAYPSRRQHSNPKKAAREKFAAALKRGALADDMIRGAENYAAIMKREGTDPRYIAQAVTWLSQCRWEDQPELDTSPPSGQPGEAVI